MAEHSRRWFLTRGLPGIAALMAAYLAGNHDGKKVPSKDQAITSDLLRVRETLKTYYNPDFLKNITPDNIFGGDLLSTLDTNHFPGNLKTHPLMYDAIVNVENSPLEVAFAPKSDPNGQIAIFLEDDEKTGRMEFSVLSPTQKPALETLRGLAESVFQLPPDLAWETFLESEHGDSLGLRADIAIAMFTQGGLRFRAMASVDGSMYMDFMPEPPGLQIRTGSL